MTTGAAAVGTAAGSAIPRAIRKPHAAVGKSEAGLDPGTATTMTIAAIPAPARATRRAGSPARDRVIAMTTTTDAAAAGTAAGLAIPRVTRKHPVAAGRSEVARAHVLGPTTTMTGGHRARVIDEDDDDRRGGRRHGGWYGDPEGHSEAARRGRR